MTERLPKQINIFNEEEPMGESKLVELCDVSSGGTVTIKSIKHPEREATFGLKYIDGKPNLETITEGAPLEAAEAVEAKALAMAILFKQWEKGKFSKKDQPELDLL
jgi:hypothetical protein